MTLIRVFHHDNVFVQFEYKSKVIPRQGDWMHDPRDAQWPEAMKVLSIHHCVGFDSNEDDIRLDNVEVFLYRHCERSE